MDQKSVSGSLKIIRWSAVVLILVLSIWVAISTAQKQQVEATGRADIGGQFELVDQDGKTVTEANFLGRPMLIYFGYAYCPDVCPTALQVMGAAMEMIGSDADKIQPVFITIDPKRDTPELLAQYVASNGFPKKLTGLTGTPQQTQAAAKVWRGIYQRSSETRGEDDYLMDHSSIIYLMAADGEFVSAFSHADSPQIVAKCLTDHLAGKICRR